MRFGKLIKEIWKQNKWDYLISGIVVTIGILLISVKNHSPLEIMIPLGWFGLLFFMFTFGFFFGGKE